jgi:hypothetical protein
MRGAPDLQSADRQSRTMYTSSAAQNTITNMAQRTNTRRSQLSLLASRQSRVNMRQMIAETAGGSRVKSYQPAERESDGDASVNLIGPK